MPSMVIGECINHAKLVCSTLLVVRYSSVILRGIFRCCSKLLWISSLVKFVTRTLYHLLDSGFLVGLSFGFPFTIEGFRRKFGIISLLFILVDAQLIFLLVTWYMYIFLVCVTQVLDYFENILWVRTWVLSTGIELFVSQRKK